MPETATLEDPIPPQRGWNYTQLCIALWFGFLLQNMGLVCLCSIGNWRVGVAFYFDLMVIVRMLVAFWRKETGKAWIIYVILCYTSVFWLRWLTDMILHFNGKSH